MSSNWPTEIDNFGQVTGTEATSQPNNAGLTHSMIHNLLADAVTALETNLQGFQQPPTSTTVETVLYEVDPSDLFISIRGAWENSIPQEQLGSGTFTVARVDSNSKFILRLNTYLSILGGGGALVKFTVNGTDYVVGAYGGEW